MTSDEKLQQIADFLDQRLSVSKVYSLFHEELLCFWPEKENLDLIEKRLRIENFANHFGFRVLVSEDATAAAFIRKSGSNGSNNGDDLKPKPWHL